MPQTESERVRRTKSPGRKDIDFFGTGERRREVLGLFKRGVRGAVRIEEGAFKV
jgi:hypothetical protein